MAVKKTTAQAKSKTAYTWVDHSTSEVGGQFETVGEAVHDGLKNADEGCEIVVYVAYNTYRKTTKYEVI